jgi:membrane associated rhomboid family serine protease
VSAVANAVKASTSHIALPSGSYGTFGYICHADTASQYWRLFIHHLAYNNSSDLFLAELLFYNLGTTIERRFGSLKFSVSSAKSAEGFDSDH